MTTYQYITGRYNGSTGNIDIWARCHETGEKKLLSITGFKPYMYVKQDEQVPDEPWVVSVVPGFKGMDGVPLKKVVATDPTSVGDNRSRFTKTYEADIRFVQRFLIDTGITSSFRVDTSSPVIPWNDITPIRETLDPVYCFLDIEVYTIASRFPNINNPTQPVIAVTFWDSHNRRYITLVIDDSEYIEKREDDWLVAHFETYERLHEYTCRYLSTLKPDIVSGWNINFDIGYWSAWLRKNSLRPLPLEGAEVFDLLAGYRKLRPSLGNRLKEVVVREELVRQEDLVSERYQVTMYDNDRKNFILYNKKDVEYCRMINDKYGILDNFWKQKNFAGLMDIRETVHHSRRHDILWLRIAHQKGIALPTTSKESRGEHLDEGAMVIQPPEGLHPDLSVLDLSRYYPNILLSFAKETSPDIWGILGPAVIQYLSNERDYWDEQLAKCTPGTYEYERVKPNRIVAKHFLSGAWGYFADSKSRIFSKEKGDFVLKKSREGLSVIYNAAIERGYRPIYGDTDSVFIQAPMDDVDELVDIINDALKEWAESLGVPPNFRVKEDRYAKNTLFIRVKGSNVGAKKRYAQWVVREDGKPCDYVVIKGFDAIRGNTSPITRSIQREVIEAALKGSIDEAIKKVQSIREKILSGSFSIDEVSIPVNLKKEFSESTSAHYYRGVMYNNKYIGEEIVPGDLVKYFKVGQVPEDLVEYNGTFGASHVKKYPPTQWLAYIESENIPKGFEPDYEWIVQQTLRSPIERILNVVGIVWDEIEGKKDLTKVF